MQTDVSLFYVEAEAGAIIIIGADDGGDNKDNDNEYDLAVVETAIND